LKVGKNLKNQNSVFAKMTKCSWNRMVTRQNSRTWAV